MHLGSLDKSVNIATKRLSFVWVIKREEQIAWIDDHLDAMCNAAPPGFLHVSVYVTSVTRPAEHIRSYPPTQECNDSVVTAHKAIRHTQVDVKPGRPNFDTIIQAEIQQSDRAE